MPALSMFYGIIVRMQSEKGGKHNIPHLHALYGDNEIVMAFDGTVIEEVSVAWQENFLQ